MKQKEEDLMKEVELLKQRINEFERLSRGWGLSNILNYKHGQSSEATKPLVAVV